MDFDAISAVIVYNKICRRAVSKHDFLLKFVQELYEEANKNDEDVEDVLEDIEVSNISFQLKNTQG